MKEISGIRDASQNAAFGGNDSTPRYVTPAFVDRLIHEKNVKLEKINRTEIEEREAIKDSYRFASYESAIRYKLMYEGGISGLKELHPTDLNGVKRLVKKSALKKTLIYGITPAAISLAGFMAGRPSIIPGIVTAVFSSALFFYPFLRNFWFLVNGYFLDSYCIKCIEKHNHWACSCAPRNIGF